MTTVFFIFILVITPVRIRPRMETLTKLMMINKWCTILHQPIINYFIIVSIIKYIALWSHTYVSSEGTLLVNVVSSLSLVRSLEPETRVAHVPGLGGLESTLLVEEDGGLLLKCSLSLISHDWIWNIPEQLVSRFYWTRDMLMTIVHDSKWCWHWSQVTWEGWILRSEWLQYQVFRAWQAEN